MKRALVWDVPVRLYHWLLAAGFVAAFAIAELADDDGPLFVVHMLLGLTLLWITLLRVVWGVVGSRYARFSGFDFRPSAFVAYFRGLFSRHDRGAIGHNPATSYAATVMIVATMGLGLSGLGMALGSEGELGELHELFAFGLLATAAIHVAGVALHAFRRRDGILLSMLDGKKAVEVDASASSSHFGVGLVGLALSLAATVWLFAGYDPATGRATPIGTTLTLGAGSEAGHGEEDHREHEKRRHGEHEGDEHERDEH